MYYSSGGWKNGLSWAEVEVLIVPLEECREDLLFLPSRGCMLSLFQASLISTSNPTHTPGTGLCSPRPPFYKCF